MEIMKAKFTYGTLERNLHNVKFRKPKFTYGNSESKIYIWNFGAKLTNVNFRKLCKPALGFLREEAHPAPATQRLSHGNAQRIGVHLRLAEV